MSDWRPAPAYRDALDEAARSLEEAHFNLSTSGGRAFRLVVDWLTWAVQVDQQLCDVGGDRYEEMRENAPAGGAIPGLRYANNVVKHHGRELGTVVDLSPGVSFPVVFPLVFREITWVPFEKLPPVPKRNWNQRTPSQQAAYKSWLADRPVRERAPEMTDFLLNVALSVDPESPA